MPTSKMALCVTGNYVIFEITGTNLYSLALKASEVCGIGENNDVGGITQQAVINVIHSCSYPPHI